jgi:integrase
MKGTVKKRGKRWYAVYDAGTKPDGSRNQKWEVGGDTRPEAEALLARRLHELNTGTFTPPAKMTVAAYLEKWLAHVNDQVRPSSFELYSGTCRRHIVPALGTIPLQKLTALRVQEFLDALRKGGRSARTVGQYRMVLRTALRQAVRWQLLARNPCDGAPAPRAERHDPTVLDAEGARQLLDAAAGSWLSLPVMLSLSAGLRRGEVLGLKWEDIDFERGTLEVRRQRNSDGAIGPPKTDRAERTLRLPGLALEALRVEREVHSLRRLELGSLYCPHGWVVCKEDGTPYSPSYFGAAFKKLAQKAGVPAMTFHDGRHTSATLAIANGVDIRTVAGRLGHSNVATTLRIYAHFLQAADHAAAVALDGVLRRP